MTSDLVKNLFKLYIKTGTASCVEQMKNAQILMDSGWTFIYDSYGSHNKSEYERRINWCEKSLQQSDWQTFKYKTNHDDYDYYIGFKNPADYTFYLLTWK